jgi:hypothetical protein
MSNDDLDIAEGLWMMGSPCESTGTHGKTFLAYNFSGTLARICRLCHSLVDEIALDDLTREQWDQFQETLKTGMDWLQNGEFEDD